MGNCSLKHTEKKLSAVLSASFLPKQGRGSQFGAGGYRGKKRKGVTFKWLKERAVCLAVVQVTLCSPFLLLKVAVAANPGKSLTNQRMKDIFLT